MQISINKKNKNVDAITDTISVKKVEDMITDVNPVRISKVFRKLGHICYNVLKTTAKTTCKVVCNTIDVITYVDYSHESSYSNDCNTEHISNEERRMYYTDNARDYYNSYDILTIENEFNISYVTIGDIVNITDKNISFS